VPEGTGPHFWARIRKQGISTEEAASRLAQAAKVSRKDLGYAGKKDTHAIATQWISLPETASITEGVIDDALEVLSLTRNQRKLKIGQLAGNQFQLRLDGSVIGDLNKRIQDISKLGVPNYFGLQRLVAQDQILRPPEGLHVAIRRDAGGCTQKMEWQRLLPGQQGSTRLLLHVYMMIDGSMLRLVIQWR